MYIATIFKTKNLEEIKESKTSHRRDHETEDNMSDTNINSKHKNIFEDVTEAQADQLAHDIHNIMSKDSNKKGKSRLSRVAPEPLFITKNMRRQNNSPKYNTNSYRDMGYIVKADEILHTFSSSDREDVGLFKKKKIKKSRSFTA
jgi:hypothetical protein